MLLLLLLLMMMTMAIVIMMMMVLRAPHVSMQQHSPTIQSQPPSCSCWEFEGGSASAAKGGGACIQHFVRDSLTSRPSSRARLSFPASSGGSSDVDSVFGGSAARAPEFATVNLWTVR